MDIIIIIGGYCNGYKVNLFLKPLAVAHIKLHCGSVVGEEIQFKKSLQSAAATRQKIAHLKNSLLLLINATLINVDLN